MERYKKVVLLGKVSKSGTLWKDIFRWYSVKSYLKVVYCGKVPKSGTSVKLPKSGTLWKVT